MLYYDFLTNKDVNNLEYFEKYMTQKEVGEDYVQYVFEKHIDSPDWIGECVVITSKNETFKVYIGTRYTVEVKTNNDVVNSIKDEILERYFYNQGELNEQES